MRKISYLLIPLLLIHADVYARQAQDKRRIEEGKRDSLNSTESVKTRNGSALQVPASKPLEIQYLSKLLDKEVADFDDATFTVVLLLGLKDIGSDFNKRVAFLQEEHIIDNNASRSFSPKSALTRGQAAYMYCRALKIKGGLFARAFSLTQRYALNELVYEGIIESGPTNSIMSGKELVSLFINSADHLLQKEVE
jgi:hypothetical protein